LRNFFDRQSGFFSEPRGHGQFVGIADPAKEMLLPGVSLSLRSVKSRIMNSGWRALLSFVLGWLAVGWVSSSLLAAPPLLESSPRYQIRNWQTDDGLPQNPVWAIAQTTNGYLWVGTQQGLVRFDGVTTTTFAVPTTDPVLAAMTTDPAAFAKTLPAALTDAMASFDELQTYVRPGIWTPSDPRAIACSCTLSPTRSVSTAGVISTIAGSVEREDWVLAGSTWGPRAAAWARAARHLLVLWKPWTAEAVETTPQASPTATIWSGFTYWSGLLEAASAPKTFSEPQTTSSTGAASLSVQLKLFICS
jgi:hypothetical protein